MKRCVECLDEAGTNRDCPACRGEDVPAQDGVALPAGTWLVGAGEAASRYVLGRVLGSGGFGITYLALHVQLGQKVAIKELFPRESVYRSREQTVAVRSASEAGGFEHLRRRFVEEARTLGRLPDDGRCVRALDILEANGTAYMVMEYVQGESLRELRAREGGRLDVGLVHWLGVELSQALAHLHSHGLVHRDMAPDNVMLTVQHRVKLIDFGAARFVTEGGASKLSRVWKVGYAPPEQMADDGIAGTKQGPWTDVYALGATLYELVSGQRPPDAMSRYVSGTTSLRPQLDAAQARHPQAGPLCDAIELALRLDATERPQSGAALLERLGGSNRTSPNGGAQRKRWPWAAGAAVVLALLVAAYAWGRRDAGDGGDGDGGDGADAREFVEVPAAGRSFEMSSRGEGSGWVPYDDEVPHRVSFRRSFWMQATEVTQGEWDAFVRSWNDSRAAGAPEAKNPSHFTACGSSCPVESVSWWDAVAYANWRSDEAGVQRCYELHDCSGAPGKDFECTSYTFAGLDCRGYRLPTEAEWEYAARSGTEKGGYPPRLTVEVFNAPELADIAVYWGNMDSGTDGPQPVKSKDPNDLGLYDMIGNVWEWTDDGYQGDLGEDPKTDPRGEADRGGSRVVRGCSWSNDARNCRAANRNNRNPTNRDLNQGFRLVVSAAPELGP